MAGDTSRNGTRKDEAPALGDHLAMDLLNTEARSDGQAVDYWRSGDDVLKWLAQRDALPSVRTPAPDRAELLTRARALRALGRRLVELRRDGKSGNVAGLNEYLDAYLSAPHLNKEATGKLTLKRIVHANGVAALLGPVAEAVAALLAEGDFSLVKQCEHPDCVLWFYDRTKGHKRRWCSMASCGNRHKAAQFRRRNALNES